MDDRPIGACDHGNPVHYRYPCGAKPTLTQRISDELAAGFTPENGLLARIHRLAEDQFDGLFKRINQGR